MRGFWPTFLVSFWIPGAARAEAPPGAVAVVRAAEVLSATAMRVDGDFDEDVWKRAPVTSGFRQREPSEGDPPTYKTEVRVAFDRTHLYIAVRAFDPDPAQLAGLLTRRDQESPSDWVSVFIDSYRDRRTAFEFGVNPAGVKQDRYWFNDSNNDPGWDAVWDVSVKTDAQGWQAEFRIPFSQLRYSSSAVGEGRFGFAVSRAIARLNETSTWPLLARSASGFVSMFGELHGLELTGSRRRLEVMPYVVSQVATAPADPGNPLARTADPGASLGLDLKYALTSGLTLTATVNPDFGQVEADPAVVNLTAFETFFPERRPFFLEGSGTFAFDLDCNDGVCSGLFYSRRIGRAPQVEADVPDEGYMLAPAQTTILGATKVTGRVGGFSVGAMNALTAGERAQVAGGGGSLLPDQTVEPFTSYTVVRARREFANRSSLGFMTTATNRDLQDPRAGTLARQAYTSGVDGEWRWSDRYKLAGYWAGSHVSGDPIAIEELPRSNRHLYQRPDAGHLGVDPSRSFLAGHAGSLSISKDGGERVRFSTVAGVKTPGFEINDLGFMRRADLINMFNWVQIRDERPSKYIRSARVNFNNWQSWNFDRDLLELGGNVNAHAVFRNNWGVGGGLNVNAETFDDRLSRGGPGGLVPPRASFWYYGQSDERRVVSAGANGYVFGNRKGSSEWSIGPTVTVRPTSALSISTGIRIASEVNDSQWVENLDDADTTHHVFGRLEQDTLGLTFRVNYTMTAALSLQVYAEPFVATGRYTNFKELADGRAPRYEDRYGPFEYGGSPDFNYRSFRTTNVLRWEYRPGSSLFIVWQQGREDWAEGADLENGLGLRPVFGIPSSNVFLVKLSYWFNR